MLPLRMHEENGRQTSILSTGGTIFSEETPRGLTPIYNSKLLLERYAPQILERYSPKFTELDRKDSTDLHFEDFVRFGGAVRQEVQDGYRSVVVAQGTDSMTYANAFFSVRFPFKDWHFGLVGAMYPMSDPRSDAYRNLLLALMLGEDEDVIGTYTYINDGEAHRASRSIKVRPNSIRLANGNSSVVVEKRAFQSINYPVLYQLNGRDSEAEIRFHSQTAGRIQEEFLGEQWEKTRYFRALQDKFGYPIFLGEKYYKPAYVVDLHPNFDPDLIDEATKRYNVFVIKATGTGGVFNTPRQMALVPKMQRLIKEGRYFAVASRVTQAVVDTSYEVNRRSLEAGAVLVGDMHSEMAIVKAELAGALARTPEEFGQLMRYPFEAEINSSIIPSNERVSDDVIFNLLMKRLLEK